MRVNLDVWKANSGFFLTTSWSYLSLSSWLSAQDSVHFFPHYFFKPRTFYLSPIFSSLGSWPTIFKSSMVRDGKAKVGGVNARIERFERNKYLWLSLCFCDTVPKNQNVSAITQMMKSLLGHSLSNKMIIRVKKAFSVQICMLKNTLSVFNVIMKHYVCHHYLDCEN